MKHIVLALALLVPNCTILAASHTLADQVNRDLINSAIKGGLVGAGLGLAVGLIKQYNTNTKNKTTWEKIKSFPWHYVLVSALVGSMGAVYYSYPTNQTYLTIIDNEISDIENDPFVRIILNKNNSIHDSYYDNYSELSLKSLEKLEKLKKLFDSPEQLIKIDLKIKSLLERISNAREYLYSFRDILGRITLVNSKTGEELTKRISKLEEKLWSWEYKVKNGRPITLS